MYLDAPVYIGGVQVHMACLTGRGEPIDTGCVPLSYSGNPGVNGVSHRGANSNPSIPCRLFTPELQRQSTGRRISQEGGWGGDHATCRYARKKASGGSERASERASIVLRVSVCVYGQGVL
jgi:hypothetical protein